MAAGDRWQIPDGRQALELDGSRGGLLKLAPIVDGWPFPVAPLIVARRLCTRMPSRYLRGQVPQDVQEARW